MKMMKYNCCMNVVNYKNIKIYRNFKNPRTEIDIDKQQTAILFILKWISRRSADP